MTTMPIIQSVLTGSLFSVVCDDYNAYFDDRIRMLILIVILAFQGLATGSLFYVVFFEILEKERQKNVNGLLQVIKISSF